MFIGDDRDDIVHGRCPGSCHRPSSRKTSHANSTTPVRPAATATRRFGSRFPNTGDRPRKQTSREQDDALSVSKVAITNGPIVRIDWLANSCPQLCVVSSGLAAMVVCGSELNSPVQWLQMFAWLTLTSTGGSWFRVVDSKVLGRRGRRNKYTAIYHAGSRFVAGDLRIFFCADLFLQLQWPNRSVEYLSSMYSASGCSVVGQPIRRFLGLLFVSLRWWKQADPARLRRVSFLGHAPVWSVCTFCWL